MALQSIITTLIVADINECDSSDISCPASSICMNADGSFECVCVNGTQMDDAGNCTGMHACH